MKSSLSTCAMMARPNRLALALALSALVGCAPPRANTTSTGGSTDSGGTTESGGSGGWGGGAGGSAIGGTGGGTESGGINATGGTNTAGSSSGSGGTSTSTGGTAGGGTNGSGGSGGNGGTGGIAGSGGAAGKSAGGSSGTGGTNAGGTTGPCDIYQAANTPCVGAHSTVRALFGAYSGNLYQVRRGSDKTTKDIPVTGPGGFADTSVQDTFCAGTTCTISYIYDQTELKNDLPLSPPPYWIKLHNETCQEASATAGKAKVGGHTVYGVYVVPDGRNTYRNNTTKGVPVGNEPESMYMVVDGKRYNDRCCFDYGNVETTGKDDGDATMDTIYFGNLKISGVGSGNGPWVMNDLENGVYAGDARSGVIASNTPINAAYVTALTTGYAENRYVLKGGDAQSGKLGTKWNGPRPAGYTPMKKEGALQLGCGGDGSCGGQGTFFEGAIVKGTPTDAVDDAVQANIVAAGYGR